MRRRGGGRHAHGPPGHLQLVVLASPRELLDGVAVPVPRRKVHLRDARPVAQLLCTRLTLSKKSAQSACDSRRMLVITLRTVAWLAICSWCSTCTSSSAVVDSRASLRSSQSSAGVTAGSCSRSRWTSCTANAREKGTASSIWITSAGAGFGSSAAPSRTSAMRSASSRARLRAATRSERRRRFSTSTTRSEIASAQSSPIVSGLDALVRADEDAERVELDPAVRVRDEGPGQPVDARISLQLSRGQLGQLPIEARRKVLLDLADLLFDDVEVVEQPLGGRRDRARLAARLRDREVRSDEGPRVLAQPRQQMPPPPLAGIAGLFGRERPRELLELLGGEELCPEGLWARWHSVYLPRKQNAEPQKRARQRSKRREIKPTATWRSRSSRSFRDQGFSPSGFWSFSTGFSFGGWGFALGFWAGSAGRGCG